MVDVSHKDETMRCARARGVVRLSQETITQINKQAMKKGDVLATARIAALSGLKQTSSLIPLCHPIRMTGSQVTFEISETCIDITVSVSAYDRTGVEMEALMGVSVAALTIYDMCKAMDRSITIESIQLEEKTGGTSGHWIRSQKP